MAAESPRPEHPARAAPVTPVGRRASREFWAAAATTSCAAALADLRAHPVPGGATAPAAPLHFCYVLDEERHLVGYAPLLAVLKAPGERPLAEIMNPRVIPIPEGAPEEAIQDFFITYGLLAFPVVDRDGRLVGVVGVEHFSDLVFEGFEGQVREEAYRSVGLQAREIEHASPVSAARLRLPWLLITLVGGFTAALVMGGPAVDGVRLAAAAAFLPLCVALAERVTLRTLTLRSAWSGAEGGARALVSRELAAACWLALVVGPLAAGGAYLWQGSSPLALAVGIAVATVTLGGAAIGLLAPLADRGGPRASRVLYPAALAVADVAAVTVFLALTRLFIPLGPR
jgi:magnesium transporter